MTPDYQSFIENARNDLNLAKAVLNAEIGEYPTPISGCDAQFNHLLAERTKVQDAIQALEKSVFVPTPRSPTRFSGVESR